MVCLLAEIDVSAECEDCLEHLIAKDWKEVHDAER